MSPVAEVSIPKRDYELFRVLNARFLPSHTKDTRKKFQNVLLSSDTELIFAVIPFLWWCQPLSPETEIRCDQCLHPSDVTVPLLRKKPPFAKSEWRFRYMGNHKQLELFDLQPYTSEQPAAIDGEQERFEETRQGVEYKQLELDLFPQQSHQTPTELVRLAA